MIAEEDFDHTMEEELVRTADSVHIPVQVPEAVHLARMDIDLEVECTEVEFGYPVVDRIEIDSEADQTEVADGFLEAGHIAVAFEVVRNSLDSKFE